MISRLSAFFATAIGLALAIPAQAVYLSNDGQGEALILPYYGVRDENDTLVVITNHQDQAKAVKVRLLEGENGRPALFFNLYLAPRDSWSFSLTEENELATISTQDSSCTVPALSRHSFDDIELAAEADSGTQGPERVKEGYIEVIEMGNLDPNGLGANSLFLDFASTPANCGAFDAAWQNGGVWRQNPQQDLSAPSGGLSAQAVFINVPGARAMAYRAAALAQFYRPQTAAPTSLHSAPEDSAPGLDAAVPAQSQLWQDSAAGLEVVEDSWSSAILAVSAALMVEQLRNEFSIEAILNQGTDWVLTLPTKNALSRVDNIQAPFSVSFDGSPGPGQERPCELAFLDAYDRHGHAPLPVFVGVPPPGFMPPEYIPLCFATNVMFFDNAETVPVLGSQLDVAFNNPFFIDFNGGEAGWAGLYLDNQPAVSHRLINPESGRVYSGLPVLGFAVQSAQNVSLNALFGVGFEHRRLPRIDSGSAQQALSLQPALEQ